MKRGFSLLLLVLLVFSMVGCGSTSEEETEENIQTSETSSRESTTVVDEEEKTVAQSNVTVEEENEEAKEKTMNIQVGDTNLTATLEKNSSVDALLEMLEEGPVTIEMQDYSNMEKVGSLGREIPTNDEQITTKAGDLILYQGNSFVIYYAPNSWNFTRQRWR